MYFSVVIFCLIMRSFLALPLNETTPLNKPVERILGGSDAPDGAYPYQVSLRTPQNVHFCGGSIINSKWILTAAHCTRGITASDVIVVAGTNYLNNGGTTYRVAQVIPHPAYIPQNNFNDIALLRMDTSLMIGLNVKPIPLALTNPAPGSECILSGWGYTSYPATNPPNNLQHISLRAISLEQCANALPGHAIGTGHVCTSSSPGHGACHGDSGGPLVSGNRQVGVVSWGIPCALGAPDIFTSVAFYQAWIRATILLGSL